MNNGHPLLMIKNSKKKFKKLNLKKQVDLEVDLDFWKNFTKLQKVECHMSTLHIWGESIWPPSRTSR